MDNIREGKSHIEGGGNGAFATKNLEKGSIIAPIPLVLIKDDQHLFHRKQLLLNYCFANKKSETILLCPLSNVVLMNHNSRSPNAELRWPKKNKNNKKTNINEYHTKGLEELKQAENPELLFEVVTTRDIQEGEEIYLDYGKQWETAFQTHREQEPSTVKSARELNEKREPIVASSDLPSNFHRYECRLEPFANEGEENIVYQKYEESHQQVLPENWDDRITALYGDNDFICWYPCTIQSINEDDTYVAHIYSKSLKKRKLVRMIQNIPRDGIRFVKAPYTSGLHSQSAFRHYIPIPDSIFPYRWREEYQTAASLNLGAKTIASSGASMEQHEANLRAADCGVYFAPSNIPNAGFGMYTAVPLMGKGVISLNQYLPIIPIITDENKEDWSPNSYFWNGMEHKCEFETSSTLTANSNIMSVNDGSLANSHSGLINNNPRSASFSPLLDLCRDPGAGAFSDYIKSHFVSEFAVGAGEEIFVDYGEAWFTGRDAFVQVPLRADWASSNRIMATLWALFSSDNQWEDNEIMNLLNLIKKFVLKNDDQYRTKVALSTVSSTKDLSHVIERNGTAQATMQVRSQEWLAKNGQCLDHVYTKASTIKQAGSGCFTRRLLKKDTIVLSSPLVTTFGEDNLKLNITLIQEKMNNSEIDINDKLLFLNYQYTHPQSSVHFFPITTAFMFNHNSPRMPSSNAQEPNAKLRWATWDKKNNYFLQRPLVDLKKEPYSVIVLDIVATRDIEIDEEVFIDYGIEWEEAWKTHLENWKSPCDESSNSYHSSLVVKRMNEDVLNPIYHAWSKHHFSVCTGHWEPSDNDIISVIRQNETIPPEFNHLMEEGKIVKEYNIEGSTKSIAYDHIGFEYSRSASARHRMPCVIMGVKKNKTLKVALLNAKHENESLKEIFDALPNTIYIIPNLSADKIEFINAPFQSDMHWKGAFRHPIHIPDDIFPPQWKDLS